MVAGLTQSSISSARGQHQLVEMKMDFSQKCERSTATSRFSACLSGVLPHFSGQPVSHRPVTLLSATNQFVQPYKDKRVSKICLYSPLISPHNAELRHTETQLTPRYTQQPAVCNCGSLQSRSPTSGTPLILILILLIYAIPFLKSVSVKSLTDSEIKSFINPLKPTGYVMYQKV